LSFLLDTNAVSETRRARGDRNVLGWFRRAEPASLYISVLTLGEIAKGIAKLAPRDAVAAAALQQWIERIRVHYSDRILDVDAEIAQAWGRLSAARPLPVIDGLIAATALVRGMTLVTRNVRDIAATGVALVNPWEG
jgi:toxin FitB